MKRFALGLLGLLAAGTASAADLSIPAPVFKAPAAAAPVSPWQNCYLAIISGAVTGSDQTGSPTAGGLVGCDWQSGALVYGFEGDASAAQITQGAAPKTVDVKALTNAAVRLGYAWHAAAPIALGPLTLTDALLYGRVGVPANFITPDNSFQPGWSVAGGVEIPIRPFTTARYEYRFNDVEGVHSHVFLTGVTLYYSGN